MWVWKEENDDWAPHPRVDWMLLVLSARGTEKSARTILQLFGVNGRRVKGYLCAFTIIELEDKWIWAGSLVGCGVKQKLCVFVGRKTCHRLG